MKITPELLIEAQEWLESDEFKQHFDNKEFAGSVRALAVAATTEGTQLGDPQVKIVGTSVIMGFGLGYLARKAQEDEDQDQRS
jgi:hypothetical protein